MIVAVYAVKGGSGRTTIAVNLAAALGLEHRGECVLIDLSLPYNHAALVANLVPAGCLALIDQPDQDKFEDALLDIALHHPTGMVIIPSALRAEQADLVTPQLTSLKDTAELLQIFEKVLKIPSARVILALNHPRPQTMVTRADAERQVERKIQTEIAYDGARFDRAAVTGQVVVETDPSCAAAKSIIQLAGSITDENGRAAKRVKP